MCGTCCSVHVHLPPLTMSDQMTHLMDKCDTSLHHHLFVSVAHAMTMPLVNLFDVRRLQGSSYCSCWLQLRVLVLGACRRSTFFSLGLHIPAWPALTAHSELADISVTITVIAR